MPAASNTQIGTFMRLFHGRETAYGVHTPSLTKDEKGKQKGNSKTVTAVPTPEVYANHLYGKSGLGIIPINEKDECYFGAIDVDEYKSKEELWNIVKIIYTNGMPLLPFKSKSGGLHLFIFFATPISASNVIPILQEFRDLLGLPIKTEIFPKQRAVGGGVGSWINLPYYGESHRCLLSGSGEEVPFDEALTFMEQNRTSKELIERFMKELPFSDGPPCLQILTLQGVRENRNNFLFSVARYYKTKFGAHEFENMTRELNRTLPIPVEDKELELTVFSSLRKKDYSYKCNDAPLCTVCNKTKCSTRMFKPGGNEVSDLSYGTLTQYLSTPTTYTWIVNGKEFKFFSEAEFLNQTSFLQQCVRELHHKPSMMKGYRWDEIVNTALANVVVVTPDPADSFDNDSTLKEYITEFLTEKSMAANKSFLRMGRTWREFDSQLNDMVYMFDPRMLKKYLFEYKAFKTFSAPEIAIKLKNMGAISKRVYIDEQAPNFCVWIMPAKSIENYVVNKRNLPDVTFEDDDDPADF